MIDIIARSEKNIPLGLALFLYSLKSGGENAIYSQLGLMLQN